MGNRFLILLLLLAIKSSASPQDSLVDRIFNLAYNMNYPEAQSLLKNNSEQIDAFHAAVLEIDMSYWQNVTGTDSPNYQTFEQTLKGYKNTNAASVQEKGIQLIYLSYKLRYELKRYKLISAISTHKNTKQLFNELKQEPELTQHMNNELFVLYNAMISYFSNYLIPLGGKAKQNNLQQAITKMKKLASSQQTTTKTMASYFLGRTFLKYESQPQKSIAYFKNLTRMYPQNTRFPILLKESQQAAEN
jgi:hypothetical protein